MNVIGNASLGQALERMGVPILLRGLPTLHAIFLTLIPIGQVAVATDLQRAIACLQLPARIRDLVKTNYRAADLGDPKHVAGYDSGLLKVAALASC